MPTVVDSWTYRRGSGTTVASVSPRGLCPGVGTSSSHKRTRDRTGFIGTSAVVIRWDHQQHFHRGPHGPPQVVVHWSDGPGIQPREYRGRLGAVADERGDVSTTAHLPAHPRRSDA